MFTETVPNGVVGLRPMRPGAFLYLAHVDDELRGEGSDRWLLPAGGLILGREMVMGGYRLSDPKVSRKHAVVEPADGGAWQVRDLGSRNGTGVNGRAIDGPHRLRSGDVLRVGDTLVVFAAPCPPLPAADVATHALGVVGHSAAIVALRQHIEQAARGRAHVLVIGENGTGKEVVARALHATSTLSGPFVPVVPSGADPDAVRDALFVRARAALAHGGTLFLDGVTELPAPLAAQLEATLAAADSASAPVRVIASTCRALAAEVAAGRFRADLHARLAACTLVVPPLRARREDIPLLVADLLGELGARDRGVDTELAQALLLCEWPLNVRGLHHVLETALRLTPAGAALALSEQVQLMLAAGDASTAGVPPALAPTAARPEGDVVAQVQTGGAPIAAELREALRASGGNIAEAARHFGCSRQQIYRWMRALGVDAASFRPR